MNCARSPSSAAACRRNDNVQRIDRSLLRSGRLCGLTQQAAGGPVSRDRHLVRLRAAFADLDARLLVADAPPSLSDMLRDVLLGLWRRTFEDALPIRARIVRGPRIKITTLLAVMREARADGPVR